MNTRPPMASDPLILKRAPVNNPKGAAFLRMFVDVEDAPSADDYGRAPDREGSDDLRTGPVSQTFTTNRAFA
jgi:hypothetical protein